MESASSSSSPSVASFEESVLLSDNMNSQFFGYINKQAVMEKAPLDNINHCPITTGVFANGDCSIVDTSQVCAPERSTDKRISRKSNREMLRREDITIFDSCEEASRTRATSSTPNNISSKEAFIRHKVIIFKFLYVECVNFCLIMYFLIITLNYCCSQELVALLYQKRES